MNVYEKIKILCKERKISVFQLEKELGFSNGSIRKWNTTSPAAERVKRVADYLGCTVDELLKEE